MENDDTDSPPCLPSKVSLIGVHLTIRNLLLTAAWIEAFLEYWHWKRAGNSQLAQKWEDEEKTMYRRLEAFSDEFKQTYSLYQRAEFVWFIHQTKSFDRAWEDFFSTAKSCESAVFNSPGSQTDEMVEKVKWLKTEFEQIAHAWLEKHPAEIYLDEVRDPLEDLAR
jgi:hypothetical protein